MHVRPATRADIEAFSDMPNKPTILAWAGEVDGEIIALGGIAFSNGRWFGFCDLKDEARKYKMTIMRTTKGVFEEARRQGIRYVYAEADSNEPKAERWLASLGFELNPKTSVYRWSA